MWLTNLEITTQCLVILLTAVILFCWSSARRTAKMACDIPGPVPLPIVGNLCQLLSKRLPGGNIDILGIAAEMCEKYNGLFRVWFGGKLGVAISAPEHLEIMFTDSGLMDRSFFYDIFSEILGEGSLFVANGHRWKVARKQFIHSFQPIPVNTLMKNFASEQKYIVDKYMAVADGSTIEAIHILKLATSHAILNNALGESMDEEALVKNNDNIHEAMRICYNRIFWPLHHIKLLFNLHPDKKKINQMLLENEEFYNGAVIKKKAEFERMQTNGEPIPNLYIFNFFKKFPNEPILSVCNEFKTLYFTVSISTGATRDMEIDWLIQGMDTTAGIIGYVFLMIALHSDVQEKIFQEDQKIMKLFEGKEQLDIEDLQQYKYLDRVIKETLRLFPVAPIIGRQLSKDTYFGKHLVPKGAEIVALLFMAFRNPEIFPDPLKFDPDRFLPEQVAKLHPFAYVPFAAGPRVCPGTRYAMAHIKMVVSVMVRHFSILSHYKDMDDLLSHTIASITTTDILNFPVKIVPRIL